MPKKQKPEISRQDAILSAALPLFLENGYEKTSIRMIAQSASCEVGLVYYYFETKEEIFEKALDLCFEDKEKAVYDLSEDIGDPFLFIDSLFAYFEKEAPSFSETFRDNVHWTVRSAAHAKLSALCAPHIEKAISPLEEENRLAASPALSAKAIADILIPAAFSGESAYFTDHKEELRHLIDLILGAEKPASKRKDIPSFLL